MGHRQAERPTLDGSGDYARRLFGAYSDRASRDQPALLRHHQRFQRADRLSDHHQHLLQRSRRADRVHARRRLPLLHAIEHRRAGARELRAGKDRPAEARGRRIVEAGVRARLMSAPILTDRPPRMRPGAYLELLMNLTRREVKGRYSQSLFGAGWAIAQPLAMMARSEEHTSELQSQ